MKKVVVSAGLVLGLTIAVVYGYQKTESMGQNAAPKAADVNSATEQKTCPVMGGPINKNILQNTKARKFISAARAANRNLKKSGKIH